MANGKKVEKVVSADKVTEKKLLRENRLERYLKKQRSSVFGRARDVDPSLTKARFRQMIRTAQDVNGRNVTQREALSLGGLRI